MYFLSWIIVGVVTGWLTGKLVKDGGYGSVVNVVMGVGGAIGGGMVMRLASSPAYSGLVYTSLAAILGAAIVAGINAFANGRKRYA